MLEWSQKGGKPFLTVEGLLGTFNVDYEKGGVPYVTEYVARLIGDSAYADETENYRAYIAYKGPREGLWQINVTLCPRLDSLRSAASLRGEGGPGVILAFPSIIRLATSARVAPRPPA